MARHRILYLETNDDGTVGGSHQALFDLVCGLDRTEFEPVVVFYQEDRFADLIRRAGMEFHNLGARRAEEGRIRRTASPAAKYLDMARGIRFRKKFLQEHGIDLVHLNNCPLQGGADWMPAARLARIPVVSSVMARGDDEPASALWRRLFSGFDRVLPVSRIVADRWQRMGVPADRITVVHHGVDIARIHAQLTRSPEAVREELDVSEDQLLVVMGGNVREWKGQHVVLDALAGLEPRYRSRLRVVFAGAASENDALYLERLRKIMDREDMDEWVSFLGFRTDLPDLLAAADIVIHSSIEIEPGGIVVMEAMTFGTAVVASALGGHTEVLVPGTGLTFDTSRPAELTEKLRLLIDDPDLRQALGQRARERIEEFSVRRNVVETCRVYRELLNGAEAAARAS